MIVGCPKEIKTLENRIGLVPAAAYQLIRNGHKVIIENNAGVGSGLLNAEYESLGCEIVDTADEVWQRSDMIVKVKEPLAPEYARMREDQLLYTYLHLAAEPELTDAMLKSGVAGVAYETIEVDGRLPLLKPMSEVAGRMSVQVGAWCLEKHQGGKGMLLGGVPGVSPANVVIIGGGVVGTNAAKMAVGLGARVTILDTNLNRLEYLDDIFQGRIQTLFSTQHHVVQQVTNADLVVGAVLIHGARAPKLVSRSMLADMEDGTVLVDVAVDQGGCVETMKVTTHDEPTFEVDGIVHYGVANMPGAVARTSTFALANATLPYMIQLANHGLKGACEKRPELIGGVNTYQGKCTYEAVAESHNLDYVPLNSLLS